MKQLMPSFFSRVIEYTTEANRRALSERAPKPHRMSGEQIVERRYYPKRVWS